MARHAAPTGKFHCPWTLVSPRTASYRPTPQSASRRSASLVRCDAPSTVRPTSRRLASPVGRNAVRHPVGSSHLVGCWSVGWFGGRLAGVWLVAPAAGSGRRVCGSGGGSRRVGWVSPAAGFWWRLFVSLRGGRWCARLGVDGRRLGGVVWSVLLAAATHGGAVGCNGSWVEAVAYG